MHWRFLATVASVLLSSDGGLTFTQAVTPGGTDARISNIRATATAAKSSVRTAVDIGTGRVTN